MPCFCMQSFMNPRAHSCDKLGWVGLLLNKLVSLTSCNCERERGVAVSNLARLAQLYACCPGKMTTQRGSVSIH